MYDSFYNFEMLPFENTPDPRFFYASEQHREALAAIEYTIRMRKGIVLVTGDIGSGKTTIGRIMLQRCTDRAKIIQLLHGHTSRTELIRHLLRSLNVSFSQEDGHICLLEKLESNLHQQLKNAKPVVLFMDEAQTLSDEALEEMRLLSNFDTNTTKLLQLVLIGQPELRDRIARREMNALRQRIVMAKQLCPLSLNDTASYISHRIRAASRDKNNIRITFSEEAVELLYRHTRGIPRMINVVCDNCMLLGFVKEATRITPIMVQQVIEDMVPSFHARAAVESSFNTNLSLAGNF